MQLDERVRNEIYDACRNDFVIFPVRSTPDYGDNVIFYKGESITDFLSIAKAIGVKMLYYREWLVTESVKEIIEFEDGTSFDNSELVASIGKVYSIDVVFLYNDIYHCFGITNDNLQKLVSEWANALPDEEEDEEEPQEESVWEKKEREQKAQREAGNIYLRDKTIEEIADDFRDYALTKIGEDLIMKDMRRLSTAKVDFWAEKGFGMHELKDKKMLASYDIVSDEFKAKRKKC